MVEVDGEWEGGDQGRRWLRVSSAMGRSRCQRSRGESIVSGGEDGEEVIFGGLNGTFGRYR